MKKQLIISLIISSLISLIIGLDDLVELIKYNNRGPITLIGFIMGYILLIIILTLIFFSISIIIKNIINSRRTK